jgi:phosphatidylserine/phosphatidylglycerophosphate/cardiolipin synthase-like enzyme
MTVTLKVYVNEDDALLVWSIPEPIPECRGFAIARRKLEASGHAVEDFLLNRVGFASDPAEPDPEAPGGPATGATKPSTEWPFQLFVWTDHDADTGDRVSYRVIPMIRNANGELEQDEAGASDWSPEKTLGDVQGAFKPYFNRGFVMSQFMARYLAERGLSLPEFKEVIRDEDDTTIRRFLAGDLRLAVLQQLQAARDDGGEVFAALFELSDDELIGALCELGGRAHVILSNGSISAAVGEGAATARLRDQNARGRAELAAAGVDVSDEHRFTAPAPLGHNKLLVRVDPAGQPIAAWTGSMNWSPTGLCTQVNNGLLIEEPQIAQIYRDYWQRLHDAGSKFPKSLTDFNGQQVVVGDDISGRVRSTVWFTRTRQRADLEALRAAVAEAREGILFLMFSPGLTGLLGLVQERATEPNLYVRGVVSDLPRGPGDESEVAVTLLDSQTRRRLRLNVIQPRAAVHSIANFAEEVTREQFKSGIGHAIIHSKVLVIDPFSADPVVITGSHNFSIAASEKNDENFIIVKGNHQLAEAYAVNILGAYAHYRWRSQLRTPSVFQGLKDDDSWQEPKLRAVRPGFRFWGI